MNRGEKFQKFYYMDDDGAGKTQFKNILDDEINVRQDDSRLKREQKIQLETDSQANKTIQSENIAMNYSEKTQFSNDNSFMTETQPIIQRETPNTNRQDNNATVLIQQEEHHSKSVKRTSGPMVGWLVCIKGADKGKDYRVYSGVNTLGRQQNNDIYVASDPSISRQRHASIEYDWQTKRYFIQQVNGVNPAYVNGIKIDKKTELKHRDICKIGQSEFMLVSVCNDTFSWSEK